MSDDRALAVQEQAEEFIPTWQKQALAKLREPFDPADIDKLPKGIDKSQKKAHCNVCGGFHEPASVHLDYVGHAAITNRLLDVDAFWSWEPLAVDQTGSPVLERENGKPVGLWIRLTVAGMTRIGYGSVEPGKGEAVKELIGDAIRNAGMRFGMALELWKKGSRETIRQPRTKAERTTPQLHADDVSSSAPQEVAPPAQAIGTVTDGQPATQEPPGRPSRHKSVKERQHGHIDALGKQLGLDHDAVREVARAENLLPASGSMADMDSKQRGQLIALLTERAAKSA